MRFRVFLFRLYDGIRYARYSLQMIPATIAYFTLSRRRKEILLADLDAFYRVEMQTLRLCNYTAFINGNKTIDYRFRRYPR